MKKLLVILLAFMLVFPFTAGVAASSNSPEKTAVAYMKCKFKCGCTSTGTGTMVAVNGLITSAHNLVCSDHNKSLKSCEFYFGQTKSGKYSYKYTGRFNFTWYADFSNGYNTVFVDCDGGRCLFRSIGLLFCDGRGTPSVGNGIDQVQFFFPVCSDRTGIETQHRIDDAGMAIANLPHEGTFLRVDIGLNHLTHTGF